MTDKTVEKEHEHWKVLYSAFKATGTKKLGIRSVCDTIGISYAHGSRVAKYGIPVVTMRKMNEEAAIQLAKYHSLQSGISIQHAAKSLKIMQNTAINIQSLIDNSQNERTKK